VVSAEPTPAGWRGRIRAFRARHAREESTAFFIGGFLFDTVMVGRLPDSATAIGAVSLGSTLFYTIGLFGSGTMLGMDTLVAQAYGARRLEECHRAMWNALYFAGMISPVLMAGILAITPLFPHFGLSPGLVAQTVPFLKALVWSTLPLVLYFALRRYLQAMHVVGPVVFALIWFGLQLLQGASELMSPDMAGGVAWWAHIGGFGFGALFAAFAHGPGRPDRVRTMTWSGPSRGRVPNIRSRDWRY